MNVLSTAPARMAEHVPTPWEVTNVHAVQSLREETVRQVMSPFPPRGKPWVLSYIPVILFIVLHVDRARWFKFFEFLEK